MFCVGVEECVLSSVYRYVDNIFCTYLDAELSFSHQVIITVIKFTSHVHN